MPSDSVYHKTELVLSLMGNDISKTIIVYFSDGSVVSFQKTAVAVLASVVVFLKTAVAVLMRLC